MVDALHCTQPQDEVECSSTHKHALACLFNTSLTAVNLQSMLRPEHEAQESPLRMLHCR